MATMKVIFGLLFLMQTCLSDGNEAPEQPKVAPEPDTPSSPIVNNQPEIVPNGDNYYDEAWFEHKYMAATLFSENHMIAITISAVVLFVGFIMCLCYGCRKAKRNKSFNDDDDYATEIDIERQPFK